MSDYIDKFKIDGKVAVVCGGLGLLGKEISIALAQAGAKVIVIDIDIDQWKKFENDIKDFDISFIKFDITDLRKNKDKISKIFNEYGPIHIWVNAAYPKTDDWATKLEDINVESWRKNVDMHMNSFCLISRDVAELMKKNKLKGSIINFGSIYGVVGPDFEIYPNKNVGWSAAYSAIKGGILSFSRYLASFYGDSEIRVNCICPGGIFDNQSDSFLKKYNKKTPLGRMAKPEEIASAVLFLASEASSYITGTSLMVDGGWTCV